MQVPLLPDSAPFTPGQRAWLNGFFAGLLNIDPAAIAATGIDPAARGGANGHAKAASRAAPTGEENGDLPWHDSALKLDDRMKLAEGKPKRWRLMAAMAQLDCGACGYLCETYSKAIHDGAEKDLTRCVPGGKETAKMLRTIVKEPGGESVAVASPAAVTVTAAPSTSPASPVTYSRDNPYPAPALEVRRLTSPNSERDIRFVAFGLAGSGLTYSAGDSLGVYPRNCFEQVEALIRLMGYGGGEPVTVSNALTLPLREALIDHRNIDNPSDDLLELLAACATDPAEAAILRNLIEGGADPGLVEDPRVIDVVARFPSARPLPSAFAAALGRLQPRLYSISSSQRVHPDQVHLTVGIVRYVRNGTRHKGVASTFLADRILPFEPVRVFVQKSHGFGPPADPSRDAIMIGPGTGVAPFRAFLQDRESLGATGRNWLFFGNQRRADDYLYEDELTRFENRGVLHRLSTAFSRDQEKKTYVQDRMIEQADELWKWIEGGAHVYVCGDAKKMAADVDASLRKIIADRGGIDDRSANDYVKQMAVAGRYQRDVY